MRFKSMDDISGLGVHAKKQIEAVLKEQGGFNNQRRASSVSELKSQKSASQENTSHNDSPPAKTKKPKPSRVMKTGDEHSYCPWPSTDPFVAVHQRLEKKYGRYSDGGMLLTELILDGGAMKWRFDLALISAFEKVEVVDSSGSRSSVYLANTILVESDGFGFHRSKEAFKNDRTKQTHALKNGFAVKRITNEDARKRLDEVMEDIDQIFAQPRLYTSDYTIAPRGKTQSVFSWVGAK
jgi:hypothetical protein